MLTVKGPDWSKPDRRIRAQQDTFTNVPSRLPTFNLHCETGRVRCNTLFIPSFFDNEGEQTILEFGSTGPKIEMPPKFYSSGPSSSSTLAVESHRQACFIVFQKDPTCAIALLRSTSTGLYLCVTREDILLVVLLHLAGENGESVPQLVRHLLFCASAEGVDAISIKSRVAECKVGSHCNQQQMPRCSKRRQRWFL